MFTDVRCTQRWKKAIMECLKAKKRATHPFWAPFTIMFDGPANE